MNYTDGLNNKQKEAVLQTEGPVIILAGAGSGKTRVLTHRLAYLIEQGVKPYNILAITFTNKAAKEMKERAEKLHKDAEQSVIATFHSFCVRVLRRELNHIGYDNNFVIYDTDDSMKLIKEIIKDFMLDDKTFKANSVFSAISSFKDKGIDPVRANKISVGGYFDDKVCEIYEEYENRMEKYNALDFNDILLKTLKLFKENEDVLAKYQYRYKYIMIDEYQDTNMVQYELVLLLAQNHQNICVVGDDDQSIYSFRGADITNILEFEKDYNDPTVIKLEQNYRSTSNILDAGNAVVKNNKQRKSKALWTDKGEGELIEFEQLGSDFDEARYVVNQIRNLGSKDTYNEFAVLYRTNAQSRLIEDNLVKAGIPYQLFGGTKFYDRKEIKDTLAYLKLIHNNRDEMALKRIINEPKRGIGLTTVDKLAKYANENGVTIFDVLARIENIDEFSRPSKKLAEFYKIIQSLIEFSEENRVNDLIEEVINLTGYKEMLMKENTEESHGRLDNIFELVSKAEKFHEDTENGDLTTFLEEVSLVAEVDNYDEDASRVVLMTIHTSKGLEFNNVFIIGAEENVFPSYRAIKSLSEFDIEEERRLMYVAVTRAKEKLFITCAESRRQFGDITFNKPSRFVEEIPKELFNVSVVPKKQDNTIQRKPQKSFTQSSPSKLSQYFSNNQNSSTKKELDFVVGDRVKHLKYGPCEVLEIKSAGADFQVKLVTPKQEVKTVMGLMSKLKKF